MHICTYMFVYVNSRGKRRSSGGRAGEITHFDGIKMSVFLSLSVQIAAHLHCRISLQSFSTTTTIATTAPTTSPLYFHSSSVTFSTPATSCEYSTAPYLPFSLSGTNPLPHIYSLLFLLLLYFFFF